MDGAGAERNLVTCSVWKWGSEVLNKVSMSVGGISVNKLGSEDVWSFRFQNKVYD